jgi:two-component system cell cycle response regulator
MTRMKTLEQLNIRGPLPSPKGVALAILDTCRRDDASLAEVARVAQADPALSGRLIRQANCAARAGRPVASVPEAIQHIGLGTVRQLALGFSLVDNYSSGTCQGFDYSRFWSHSLLMAVGMQELGGLVRAGSPDELFACGLMARIGCLALATAYPDEYAALLEGGDAMACLAERERRHLETDHNELSAAMLSDWGIPHALVEPVFHHELPEESGFSPGSRPYLLAHLLFLASHLADLGLATESKRGVLASELMPLGSRIGLDAECLDALVNRVVVHWREWSALFRLSAAVTPSFPAMRGLSTSAQADKAGEPPLRILLVDGHAASRLPLEKKLSGECGHAVYSAANGQEALAMALEVMPQVVITDWLMPVMDGLEFCRALRSTEWGKTVYVLVLTSVVAENHLNEAFDAGVDGYIVKPVSTRDLRIRLRAAWRYAKLQEDWTRDRAQLKQFAAELATANRKLEHAALTDPLTDLPNRRAAMTLLDQAWSAATRAGASLTTMMVDIDHFKRINDEHGHAVGDAALREVAGALHAAARKEDNICRVGGEEFLVICLGADLKTALLFAGRLRQAVKSLNFMAGGKIVPLSISVGVATREAEMGDAEAMVNAADRALYAAKHAGRDRACLITKGKLHCGNP